MSRLCLAAVGGGGIGASLAMIINAFSIPPPPTYLVNKLPDAAGLPLASTVSIDTIAQVTQISLTDRGGVVVVLSEKMACLRPTWDASIDQITAGDSVAVNGILTPATKYGMTWINNCHIAARRTP